MASPDIPRRVQRDRGWRGVTHRQPHRPTTSDRPRDDAAVAAVVLDPTPRLRSRRSVAAAIPVGQHLARRSVVEEHPPRGHLHCRRLWGRGRRTLSGPVANMAIAVVRCSDRRIGTGDRLPRRRRDARERRFRLGQPGRHLGLCRPASG